MIVSVFGIWRSILAMEFSVAGVTTLLTGFSMVSMYELLLLNRSKVTIYVACYTILISLCKCKKGCMVDNCYHGVCLYGHIITVTMVSVVMATHTTVTFVHVPIVTNL